MKVKVFVLAILFTVFGVSGASADIVLFDCAFFVDGTTYEKTLGDSMPTSGSLDASGLGTLTWTTSTAGPHNFIAFFDHELSEAVNTFFNEYGSPGGPPPGAGISWEIDEPGYVFGNIYGHVLAGALDGLNAVPSGSPEDVSMAWGWNFNLAAGETATITLALADTAPASGSYLRQTDPDSQEYVYFSGALRTEGGGGPVIPEPATMMLFGSGLVGLAGLGRRKLFKK